jgi:tetratricopeptide (TPR) repeat protein
MAAPAGLPSSRRHQPRRRSSSNGPGIEEPGRARPRDAARAYYNSGQIEAAAEAFGHLLDLDPSAAYSHFGRGQALKRLGRRDEARTHLRLAVALAPGSRLYQSALDRLG